MWREVRRRTEGCYCKPRLPEAGLHRKLVRIASARVKTRRPRTRRVLGGGGVTVRTEVWGRGYRGLDAGGGASLGSRQGHAHRPLCSGSSFWGEGRMRTQWTGAKSHSVVPSSRDRALPAGLEGLVCSARRSSLRRVARHLAAVTCQCPENRWLREARRESPGATVNWEGPRLAWGPHLTAVRSCASGSSAAPTGNRSSAECSPAAPRR